jgi:hydroxylaminobenzene mutase
LRAESDENTCRKAFTPTEAESTAAAREALLKPLAKEAQGRPAENSTPSSATYNPSLGICVQLASRRVQQALTALGLILFLLGLLTGLAVPAMRNPRMGVASHLQGMTNGPFLIIVALLWPQVDLPHPAQIVTVVLVVYGAYANWLATQLGALWGAGRRFAPGATGTHQSTTSKERTVDLLLVSLAPAMIAAAVLLLVGVLR